MGREELTRRHGDHGITHRIIQITNHKRQITSHEGQSALRLALSDFHKSQKTKKTTTKTRSTRRNTKKNLVKLSALSALVVKSVLRLTTIDT